MIFFQYCLFLLLASALARGIAPRLKVPVELLLLVGSILVSLVPGVPYMSVPPDLIFYVFLPPILFAAAFFTSLRDFLQNLRPIFFLAVGLVLVTTLSVGYLVHWLIPAVPLSIGMLLGAIVSPPDAAAAAAFAKQLKLPRRVVTILEGESLLNDATALVAFRFAILAVTSGKFDLPSAIGSFFILSAGGALIGTLIGWAGMKLIQLIRNPTAEVLISFITAFLSYLIAEKCHVSGVVATVCAGIYFGRTLSSISGAETRIEATGAWNVILLSINGIIFTVIGLQLPSVIGTLIFSNLDDIFLVLAAVVAVLIGIRFFWVFAVSYLSQQLSRLSSADAKFPPWKNLTIISWSGMRGIVTLATVLAIPEKLPNGTPFPYRELCFLIAYSVILITLIVPSFTLPFIVRLMKLPYDTEHEMERSRARLLMAEKVKELLSANTGAPSAYQIQLLERYKTFIQRVKGNLHEDAAFSSVCNHELDERRSLQQILATERQMLHQLRKERKLHDEIFHQLEDELDIEQLRLERNARPIF